MPGRATDAPSPLMKAEGISRARRPRERLARLGACGRGRSRASFGSCLSGVATVTDFVGEARLHHREKEE